jgi:septum formation protein
VAADTIAVCGGEFIGKPADRRDAAQILRQLSGRRHEVISGLCVWPKPGGTPRTAAEVTRLVMDRLSDSDIETYLETGLWQGKAGAFGYQDGMDWVHIESGSESNVVGLPMELLEKMLREAGSDVH